jgi:hypothetical protein
MSLSYAEETSLAGNYLDLLEEIVVANNWPPSSCQLALEISGGRGADRSRRIGLTR